MINSLHLFVSQPQVLLVKLQLSKLLVIVSYGVVAAPTLHTAGYPHAGLYNIYYYLFISIIQLG